MSPAFKSFVVAVFAGVAYGLVLRAAFEWRALSGALEIVSYSFLVVMPFALGSITTLFIWRGGVASFSELAATAAVAMTFFMLAMFALFIEGMVCMILVVPVFLVAAMVGALFTGVVLGFTTRGSASVGALALLPLLLAPIERQAVISPEFGTVRTTIEIAAEPDVVWSNITSVKDIRSNELGSSFMHAIGLPRPLSAQMDGAGVGASRVSTWEKGVRFKETMVEWAPPHVMTYDFDIPKGSIPREALDRHVELGGDYFTVVRGGYEIRPSAAGHSTVVLWTTFHNRSHLVLYGNLWARFVLDDFHGSILGLVKRRSEIGDG